jgi:CheY-like chemotaxis protein
MIETEAACDDWLEVLETALQDLYNPAALRKSPLLRWLAADKPDPLATTRKLLTDAIRALKPGEHVPDHANAWRIYHILRYRYVEQLTQKEVASELLLSVRQLRRLEPDALQVLADYLWEHYPLSEDADEMLPAQSAVPDVPAPSLEAPGRHDELVWLRKSLPDEVTDVQVLIDHVTTTIMPLADLKGVHIAYELTGTLPLVRGSAAAMRQAFLALLAAAMNGAAERRVFVAVGVEELDVVVHFRVPGGQTRDEATLNREILDKLQMTQQLCSLFGGELEVPVHIESGVSFAATLRLPGVVPVQVLVIDDNVDLLRLLKRYLEGTLYTFVGVSDPEEALLLAAEMLPRIIVMDVMLPGIDGWELLGRLRAHPKLQNVLIVVCTILPQEQLALALGAAGFLRKPVSREDILDLLGRLSSTNE